MFYGVLHVLFGFVFLQCIHICFGLGRGRFAISDKGALLGVGLMCCCIKE